MREGLIAAAVAALVIIFWLLWASHSHQLAHFFNGSADTALAGSWGDSFGAFNTLFGALGFTAVFMTLVVQQRALSMQQADQHRQRFEATFFQLLQLMRNLRGEITYRHSRGFLTGPALPAPRTLEGIEAIGAALKELNYWRVEAEYKGTLTQDDLGKLYSDRVHRRFERHFGPYFRIVYTILRRIKDDKFLSGDEKVTFANLVRSQLTSDEIELAAYNALMPEANNLDSLLTHFHMLKYLPDGDNRTVLERYYPEQAFAGRDDD